jgi:hypothetical protein
MIHSAAAMLVVVFAVRYVGERFLGDGLVSRVLLVGVPAAAGAVVYFVMAFLLRISVLEKPAAMLRSKLGGDLLRSSLIIGSLISAWERLAAWYFNSCIYRLWVRVSCTLAGLMDESLIVGFFRADWDSKVAFLTRPVVRGLARIQGFFAGEGRGNADVGTHIALDALHAAGDFLQTVLVDVHQADLRIVKCREGGEVLDQSGGKLDAACADKCDFSHCGGSFPNITFSLQ